VSIMNRDPFKNSKIGGNVEKLKTYRLKHLKPCLPSHFTVPLSKILCHIRKPTRFYTS
jgi:hypothetical protein